MKVPLTSLFKTSGIACAHTQIIPGKDPVRRPAVLSFITEMSVLAARKEAERQEVRSADTFNPDVSYAGAVALVTDVDGKSFGRVLKPGQADRFTLKVGDEDVELLGEAMLSTWKQIKQYASKNPLTKDQAIALAGINGVFEIVRSTPDGERFPDHLASQAYLAALCEVFGDVTTDIPDHAFVRKCHADLLRARISDVNSSHRDGILSAIDFPSLLDQSGAEIELTKSGVKTVAGSAIIEPDLKQMVLANEALCRDVFSQMCGTPVDEMDVAVISTKDHQKIKETLQDRRLTGAWLDAIQSRARELTPENGFDLELYCHGSRDLLIVSDKVGVQKGIAFAYSWATGDRRPVSEQDGRCLVNQSIEEIPDPDVVSRLDSVIRNLTLDVSDDPEDILSNLT